jgi:hypothetical protein
MNDIRIPYGHSRGRRYASLILQSTVRNIPNTRLESRVIPASQCFQYLHEDTKSKTKLGYD